jgi:hypothetical protein
MADSFSITHTGNWPNETYQIVPNYDAISPDFGYVIFQNNFKYFNTPIKSVDSRLLTNVFSYKNTVTALGPKNNPLENNQLEEDYYQMSVFNNTFFTFSPSALRLIDAGPTFNYFQIDLDNPEGFTEFHSYILYPFSLYLRPISAKKINDNSFEFVTSAVLLSAQSFYYLTTTGDVDAYINHLNYKPKYRNLPTNINLNYSISGFEFYADRQLPQIYSSQIYNFDRNAMLLNNPVNIRPDYTSFNFDVIYPPFTFQAGFPEEQQYAGIAQENPENYRYVNGFTSAYISRYDPRISSIETFQLVQSSLNELSLDNISNCILRCELNVSNSNLKTFIYKYRNNIGNSIPLVSAVTNTNLGIRYAADYGRILNTSVHSNIFSFKVGTEFQNVQSLSGFKIASNVQNFDTAVWNLKYPPHYYSYKTYFDANSLGFNKNSDTSYLNFYLSSQIISEDDLNCVFKNVLTTDFNTLVLDLTSYATKDSIKFTPINVNFASRDISLFRVVLSSITAQYSPDNVNFFDYNLNSTPWINAASAQFFKIYYNKQYGEMDFVLNPCLSTSIGTNIDSKYNIKKDFAKGSIQTIDTDLFLTVLDEKENQIDLTVKSITSMNEFPFRDLTNTVISWNVSPSSNLVSINAIDSDGKFLQKITPNQPVSFDFNTYTVRVSGYAKDTTTITFSSQFWGLFDSIQTNQSLFNIYKNKKFQIGLLNPVFNNFDTKQFRLTAFLEYEGQKFDIPKTFNDEDVYMYWTWKHDEDFDDRFIPVNVYDKNLTAQYQYGQSGLATVLSSIYVEVKNKYDMDLISDPSTPFSHEITFYLFSNISVPPVSGQFSLTLDAYPAKSVFNTDFRTTYNGFPNVTVSDTRNNQYVITRPDSDNNNFVFFANTDILPTLSAQSFAWLASSDNGTLSALSSTKFSDISAFRYRISNPNIKVTTITLSAIKALIPNWTERFDTQTKITIYTEPSAIFFDPLKFTIYPPFMWGLSGRYVKLLQDNDYTLAANPTAYANTISETHGFYISANKVYFDSYKVYSGNDLTYVDTITSKFEYVEIPFRTEFFQNTGLRITLASFGEKYPEYNGFTYQTLSGSSIVTLPFNNFAFTIPFSSTVPVSAKFTQSPKLKQYDTLYLTFSSTITSIDIDENRIITVDQFFTGEGGKPLSGFPTQNLQEILSGNVIVYTLSSPTWKVNQFIPALQGRYQLFILAVGDPAQPLNISKYKYNSLNLSASGNMPVWIPPSTFDLYPVTPLTANCIAYWNFNEVSGNRIDSTGNGYNLMLSSIPSISSLPLTSIGFIGSRSLSASVTGVFLQTTGINFEGDWSISYWQKLNVPESEVERVDNFITKSSEGNSINPLSGIMITTSPMMIYENYPLYEQAAIYNGPYPEPYKWNHIVFSAKNKLLSVWINSVKVVDELFLSDALLDYMSISNNYPFRINGQNRSVEIDEMGIWYRALEGPDIYALYNYKLTYPFPYTLPEAYIEERQLWKVINQPVTANPLTLVAYSTSVIPEVYVSTYFALTGQEIFIQFETPENNQNLYITSYRTNFGDLSTSEFDQPNEIGSNIEYSDINDTVRHSYKEPGIYNLSFDVIYNTGEIKKFNLESPITIYTEWPNYDQQKIRFLNETVLNFGDELENTYTLDQIDIQPNEFGDVDIFNTSITRLYNNFEYLKFNSQTINTNSPTLFYGWLGTEENNTARGIQWNTKDYGFFEWDKPYLASLRVTFNENLNNVEYNKKFFSNIICVSETKDHLLVIDGTEFRAFSSGKIPQERFFENIEDIRPLIPSPVSIDSFTDSDNSSYVYVADNVRNRIYKFNLDFSFVPQINVQLVVGNFGKREEPNKFNAPSKIIYANDFVYVLDYNNQCVKQFTSDLNWTFTYFDDAFDNEQPEALAVHPNIEISFLYVLTNQRRVFIFDQFNTVPFQIIDLPETFDSQELMEISFDEAGEFFYVLTRKNIYKYTISGTFIGDVDIPNSSELNYNYIKQSQFHSMLICSDRCILKIQDLIQLYRIGDGLEQRYWSLDQLLLNRNEFADDTNYNRCMIRLVQNIKNFRNIFNSKFVVATEQLPSGTVSYFTLVPISTDELPSFSNDIENENIGVGVNELHVPPVLNREFKKIYESLDILREYLTVSDIRIQSGLNKGCFSPFCWSWRAMSCYNLSLPVIRICNINPITYIELEKDFPVKYAPTTIWGEASASCCKDFNQIANPLYQE